MTARYDKLLADWPADVPFERVVRQRLPLLDDLINQGITWSAIAGALARAGITQRSGRPLSWRQLNAVYLRCKKKSERAPVACTESDFPAPPVSQTGPSRRGRPEAGLASRLSEARDFGKIRSFGYDE